jgi:DNA polymerase
MTMPEEKYAQTPPLPAQAALEFLQEARQLIAFQQAIGIEGYPRTPELARFMLGQQQAAAPVRQQTSAASKPAAPQASSAQPQKAASPPRPDTTLTGLYAEIQDCRLCCRRQQSRSRVIASAGSAGVKLLIIGDAPSAEDDLAGTPMSGEPGLLLDKMLAAIGLNRAMVHLSLTTRCHSPEPISPEAVDACLPFLLKEIQLVAPKVICTMGPLTAQKLLHSNKPLSQLRGRFHDFQGIALMPTFSPEFLLKVTEMKKATWTDLQLIQKRLQAV